MIRINGKPLRLNDRLIRDLGIMPPSEFERVRNICSYRLSLLVRLIRLGYVRSRITPYWLVRYARTVVYRHLYETNSSFDAVSKVKNFHRLFYIHPAEVRAGKWMSVLFIHERYRFPRDFRGDLISPWSSDPFFVSLFRELEGEPGSFEVDMGLAYERVYKRLWNLAFRRAGFRHFYWDDKYLMVFVSSRRISRYLEDLQLK